MYKKLLVISGILFAPAPALTQEANLSPSEQAAVSERAATSEERALRREGCTFWSQLTQNVQFTNGNQGWRAELPDMQLLLLQSVIPSLQLPGRFDITAFPKLPNGGIGGKDVCAVTTIVIGSKTTSVNNAIRHIALMLRHNIDVEAEYPTTFQAIRERNQIRNVSGGMFALIGLDDSSDENKIIDSLLNEPMLDPTKDFIRLSNVLLVPLR